MLLNQYLVIKIHENFFAHKKNVHSQTSNKKQKAIGQNFSMLLSLVGNMQHLMAESDELSLVAKQ